MGCEGCTTKSKIFFGLGGVFGLVGVILLIVSGTAGSAGAQVDFAVENTENPSISVTDPNHCGYVLYIKADAKCTDVMKNTKVHVEGKETLFMGDCDSPDEQWAKDWDPPLQKLGHFFLKDQGTGKEKKIGKYVVTSKGPIWAMDWCGQIGEAVSGFLAMLGLFVVAVIIFIVSCICCCIGCCCMGKGQTVVVVAGGPQQETVKTTAAGTTAAS